MARLLSTPVEYLKGVGPVKGQLLRSELGIETFHDLLYYFPYRYVDRSRFTSIREIDESLPYVLLRGKLVYYEIAGQAGKLRLVARLQDETGRIELIWFHGIRWMKELLQVGHDYIVFGKPQRYGNRLSLVHPEIEKADENRQQEATFLKPFYHTTEKCKARGLNSRTLTRLMRTLIDKLKNEELTETLPESIRTQYRFPDLKSALFNIHFATDNQALQQARQRLKFEELFYLQLNLLSLKLQRHDQFQSHRFVRVGEIFNHFYHHCLPFPLTGAQKKVIREIRADTATDHQMNRLIQGDVGSGKTIVALMSMLLAVDNGCQACLMAPTEILAMQHYETIRQLTAALPISVRLLTGSTRPSERKEILTHLANGSLNILIGTHALIEDTVQFKQLGLAVIDEQHRFGVEQRARLWMNEPVKPHVLVMTATPIPRTLAMTLYGDLDVSIINELPPGRKPVTTHHLTENQRLALYGFIRKQIQQGRQVYIVYPLIEESEKADYANLMAGYENLIRHFPEPQYRVSMVHGKQKAEDRQQEMKLFVEGRTHIMVATTVIEVGVNVPNASVMVIESAERFGLSQLHQLRGRVGRGCEQSYCLLMTGNNLSPEAAERIRTMIQTSDGFLIAEADMRLRGPGNILGTQQSGVLKLKIADLVTDSPVVEQARQSATKILQNDPYLQLPEHAVLREKLILSRQDRKLWEKVS
jgi:ATP-dependent DNA helicase RecG